MPILNKEEKQVFMCMFASLYGMWLTFEWRKVCRQCGGNHLWTFWTKQRGGEEGITWPQKSAGVLVEEWLDQSECEGAGSVGVRPGLSNRFILKLPEAVHTHKLICPTDQRRAAWDQEPGSSCPD